MPYVQRDENNNIIGVFNREQPGFAEEWLEPDDPEIIAFYNPPVTDKICPACNGSGRVPLDYHLPEPEPEE